MGTFAALSVECCRVPGASFPARVNKRIAHHIVLQFLFAVRGVAYFTLPGLWLA